MSCPASIAISSCNTFRNKIRNENHKKRQLLFIKTSSSTFPSTFKASWQNRNYRALIISQSRSEFSDLGRSLRITGWNLRELLRRRFDLVHGLSACARKQSVMEYRLPRMHVKGGGWRRCSSPSCRDVQATLPHESRWILYERGCAVCANLFVNLPFFRPSVCHFESGIFSQGWNESEMGHSDYALLYFVLLCESEKNF